MLSTHLHHLELYRVRNLTCGDDLGSATAQPPGQIQHHPPTRHGGGRGRPTGRSTGRRSEPHTHRVNKVIPRPNRVEDVAQPRQDGRRQSGLRESRHRRDVDLIVAETGPVSQISWPKTVAHRPTKDTLLLRQLMRDRSPPADRRQGVRETTPPRRRFRGRTRVNIDHSSRSLDAPRATRVAHHGK